METTPLPMTAPKQKLVGRAFYESIGSPKMILAPMVDQSEFAWRLLTRSFMKPHESKNLLAYTPMLHARLFGDVAHKYREHHFEAVKKSDEGQEPSTPQPFLDGNPAFDRPLTVQFCANDPDELLNAARHVQDHCDAVDLNLGCPQGIARKGKYGAFLQEDMDLIYRLINKLHLNLSIPVTAKIRILDTKEKTLEYAKMVLSAGASILTVHGRQRHQKGHETGLADWSVIRYLRDNLPADTVLFANGNVLQYEDIARCLEETGADGVMSAEGNLYNPAIFTSPPSDPNPREYWTDKDGRGGYRVDAVVRRYMDIIYKHVLEQAPPERTPLFLPSDIDTNGSKPATSAPIPQEEDRPDEDIDAHPAKRQKKDKPKKSAKIRTTSPNLIGMKAHFFNLLRPLVSVHHDVRDALGRCGAGDIPAFENVVQLMEKAVRQGLLDYEANPEKYEVEGGRQHGNGILSGVEEQQNGELGERNQKIEKATNVDENANISSYESSLAAVRACKRPYWVCQAYVRPLPVEAIEKGALTVGKKETKKKRKMEAMEQPHHQQQQHHQRQQMAQDAEVDSKSCTDGPSEREKLDSKDGVEKGEIPKEAMVCG